MMPRMASRTMRWTPRTAIHEMGSKDDTMIDTKDGKANETELKIDGTATHETCAVCLSHKYTTPAVENGLMKQMKTKGSDTEANEPRHGLKKGKDGKKQSKAMKEI